LCASCGKLPSTSYYALHVPAPPPANDPQTSFVVGVERLRAPLMLRDDRIVFYESPTELNFYQFHRWSADPSTMVSELLVRWLDQMGVFSQVRLLPAREPVDYILRGRLFNFDEVDYEAGIQGRVSLELSLVRARDRSVVWSATGQAARSAAEKGVPGVVMAINASSEQIFRELLPGLAAQVERDFKESQTRTK